MSSVNAWTWYTQLGAGSTGDIGYAGVGVTCAQPNLDTLGARPGAGQIAHAPQATAAAWSIGQRLYAFPSPHDAKNAFDALSTALARCESGGAATAPGIHRTAAADGAAAWSQYPTPVAQSMSPQFENHTYLVVRGATISIFTAGTASGTGNPSDYPVETDATILADLARHLAG